MNLILYSVFLIFYASPCFSINRTPGINIYEFGDNVGRVLYSNTGYMGPMEKYKSVTITLPGCSTLRYVRVRVNNPYEVPTVNIDWKTSTVSIQYGLFQHSDSQINIIAKGLTNEFCNKSGAPSGAKPVGADVTLEEVADIN